MRYRSGDAVRRKFDADKYIAQMAELAGERARGTLLFE